MPFDPCSPGGLMLLVLIFVPAGGADFGGADAVRVRGEMVAGAAQAHRAGHRPIWEVNERG